MTHGNTGKRNALKHIADRKSADRFAVTTTLLQGKWVRHQATQRGLNTSEFFRALIDEAMDKAD
jgi:hypothetical protein